MFTNKLSVLLLWWLLTLSVFHSSMANEESGKEGTNDVDNHKENSNHTERYKLVSFNFHHVEVPYVICLWILLASIAKIGFHLYDKLPSIFPESCLLITLGIIVGITLYYTETATENQYSLDANTFFLFLLPPIIYDAGYNMPNRAFFNNLGTILLLAVVNTLWNTVGIGLGLYGMSKLGWIHKPLSILNCFVFSALISAVDPVAVLAIFEEIQVNEILYIIVFGESLLNDGVTVVIYHMMEGFTEIGESNLQAIDFIMGICSFFLVVIGGTLIGVVYGLVGAFITKYTDHVRVIEPLFIFVLGYLAYLTAEIMELSGILALTFGGIIMRHYTEANMTKKSTTTVKYFMKMMANISETIIFMFLGLSTVIDSHEWHLDFILFTILFCLIFRVTGVIFIASCVNSRRLIQLSAIDQFIMSYGGLRGGIAFCLALLLNQHHIPERGMFVTTTMVMVFFTVFVQGITIKPVVNALKVEKAEEKEPTMNEMIHERFIDHLMAGVEDIIGKSGHNSIQHKFEYYNDTYLKPWLLREKPQSRNTSILRVFTKLSMQDAKAQVRLSTTLSRDPSFSHLNPNSPSMAALHRRRATIAVPNAADQKETVVDLNSVDDKDREKEVLESNMFHTRNTWVQERRHTLAEIHNHPPFHHSEREKLRQLISDKQANGHPKTAGKRIRKNVSFSGFHSKLNKKLSDVLEHSPQSPDVHSEDSTPKVIFSVGRPPSQIEDNEDEEETSLSTCAREDEHKSDATFVNNVTTESTRPDPENPISNIVKTYYVTMETPSNIPLPPSYPGEVQSELTTTDMPSTTSVDDSGQGSSSPVHDDPDVMLSTRDDPSDNDNSENDLSISSLRQDNDNENDEETLAQNTLPWRRQTTLPPVPSSLSISLPDDENPLMSEAPSWADNLAYSHLTETGSPYQSPQNTINATQQSSHRPVFDIFPCSPSTEEVGVLPPPWNVKDEDSGHVDEEPLPSTSQSRGDKGDKASSLLVSSHDLAPPTYHHCLGRGALSIEGHVSRRVSEASSPVHFQLMEKPETISTDDLEHQLIGIEDDYHHGMRDRVSHWLANSTPNRETNDEDDIFQDLAVDGELILESLRKKKENWVGNAEEGTEADVESVDDLDVDCTKL